MDGIDEEMDKESQTDRSSIPDGDKPKEHHLHLPHIPHREKDGHFHLLNRSKGGHHFHLIYSVKPFSVFKFLNKMSAPARNSWKLLLALAGFTIFALLPLGISYKAHMSLAIFVGVALLWTTEAIPLPVTALLVPVLLTAFGIFETSEALLPFANPVVYLLLGGVMLAGAVHKTGFDKRMLYPFLIKSEGKIDKLLLSMMLVSAILSMWISNTATVALLAPFAISLSATVDDKESSKRLTTILLLGIGFAAVIGGLGTVIGSAPNAVASAIFAEQGSWTFIDWMMIGIPTSFILLFMTWKIILKVIPIPEVTVNIDSLKEGYHSLGPMSGGEKKTLTVFAFTIVFWVSGASIGELFGFPSSFMSSAIVSLLATVALFVTGTMKWEDARIVPWGVFLIIGAGLALGDAIVKTGAAEWITSGLFDVFFGMPVLVIILLIAFVVVGISNFLSNTASAAIFIPILMAFANAMGEDMRIMVLPVALVLSLSFITPIGTPPITLIYSSGHITAKQLAKIGIIVTVPAVFVCTFVVLALNWIGVV